MAVLFLLLAQAGAAKAGEHAKARPLSLPKGARWNWLESRHFTVFSDASVAKTENIIKDLEIFRSVLSAFHPRLVVDPPRPTFLLIFKSDKDFEPYKPRIDGSNRIAGYMKRDPDLIYMAAAADRYQDASKIIYHEFLHQFLTENIANAPLWFNEGIAEYYSTFLVKDGTVSIGKPIEGHVYYLRSHPMIPLGNLFQVDYSSPEYNEAERMGTFYAQSWLVVHYLMNGEATFLRPKVVAFLDGLREGTPLDQAFESAFGIGTDAMEGHVAKYLGTGRFQFSNAAFSQFPAVDTAVRVTRMSRDEVLARLGDLLTRSNLQRSPDAEAYLQEALRINPSCATAEAGLGYLAASGKRFAEALQHYQRAMELDSENFRYPYLAAMSWMKESPKGSESEDAAPSPEEVVKAQELLRRSIRIEPQFAEAQASLGESFIDRPEPGSEGITALENARQLMPSRMDVATNLLILHLKAGERTAAAELLDQVIAPSRDGRAIEFGRNAIRTYDEALAALGPPAEAGQETSTDPPTP
jgi:tetratricopeptide (TPR) repeat protein